MKQIVLFILILCSINVFAQKEDAYSIQPYQAGTLAFTNNRSMRVVLEDNVQQILSAPKLSASYYIVFTAVDNEAYTYVTNKDNRSFTAMIKPAPGSKPYEFRIDYVVFIKRKLQQLDFSKPVNTPTQQ